MLAVRGLTVRFDDVVAVDDVSLDVASDEVVAVLGPSGCGKSTLLRAIAGLEPGVSGEVAWDGRDLAGVPVHERGFGLMFQDYALFPHRDVIGNVEFGLRMQRVESSERRARATSALDAVGLSGYEARPVATLSGGEQQRVALARVLAPEPQMLMFDEPLGALDRDLRGRLLADLRSTLENAGLPTVYVTHDHDEAYALADRIAVMRAGRIVQTAEPATLWSGPVDEWTATFLGFGPAVDATCVDGGVRTPWGVLSVDAATEQADVRVVLRPNALALDPSGPLDGRVLSSSFAGERWRSEIRLGSGPPVVVTTRDPLAVGERVALAVEPGGVLVFPRT